MNRDTRRPNVLINLALQLARAPEAARRAAHWQAARDGDAEAAAVLRLSMPYGPLRPLSEVHAVDVGCLLETAANLATTSYRAYWRHEIWIDDEDFQQGSQASRLLLQLWDAAAGAHPFALELFDARYAEELCGPRQQRAKAAARFLQLWDATAGAPPLALELFDGRYAEGPAAQELCGPPQP